MAEQKIITPLDEDILRTEGVLHIMNSGLQKIHRRCTGIKRDHGADSVSFDASPEDPLAFWTIPQFLFSKETMLYIGCTLDKATEIWRKWINGPSFGQQEAIDSGSVTAHEVFIEFIVREVFQGQGDARDGEDWGAYLDRCGVNDACKRNIARSEYTQLSDPEPVRQWATATIELWFWDLHHIQATSLARRKSMLSTYRSWD